MVLCLYFWKKSASYILQNLMLNRLAPVSNPENGKAKSSYALFWLIFFILRPRFFLFSRPFWTIGNFFQVCLNQKNWLVQTKKIFFSLINLALSVPSFYIRTKFRLKNSVITVHLLRCKTIFFIHLLFWGRNLVQIKEHPSWEASINIKKVFWFVYTCLHSSRLI